MADKPFLSYDGKLSQNKDEFADDYPNRTMKILFERASVRDFLDKKVPEDILRLILKAGTHSASAGNLQPYSIVKIEGEKRKELTRLCGQAFIAKAPVLLIFCVDFHRLERWADLEAAPFTAASSFRHFWVSFQDTIICAQNVCTAADSLGLGSVYIGSVLECFSQIREMIKLPDKVFPVVLVCLGYPRSKPLPQRKLDVDVIVHSEEYVELTDKELIEAFAHKYENIKVKTTDERLKTVEKVCRKVQNDKFAKKCLDLIGKQGYINAAQYYFSLHYRADLMPKGNDKYLKQMEEFGFNWFKIFHTKVHKELK
ncbi:MAG: nitroreductase family protein [Nitrososphaeria archaeon]|jgi:FMN reductase [NAD(P)H]